MMIKPPCSDHRSGRLVVLEGMPGAGKTTTARALTGFGLRVLGEYTSATATTLPLAEHPAVTDDDAHQNNWLRKAVQAAHALTAAGPAAGAVYADRDWLSSLAYAYSIADIDDGALLSERIAWADNHLISGNLRLPDVYAIFDLDVPTSLHRRAATIRQDHPWSHPAALQRLREFYRNPLRVVWDACPELADRIRGARRVDLDGTDSRAHLLNVVRSLGEAP